MAAFKNRTPAAGAKAPARKSRWGGIPSNEPREPIIKASANPQRVRVESCEVTFNDGSGHESFKAHATIVESDVHETGESVLIGPFIVNGKSKRVGEGRVQAMAVALMGCEDDDAFHGAYPEGEPIDNATNGVTNSDDTPSLNGREAYVIVSRGGATSTGDYFREFEWAAVES